MEGEAPPSRRLTLPLLTDRLLLRDFVASDWPAFHAYSSDPEVARYMFWGPRDAADVSAVARSRPLPVSPTLSRPPSRPSSPPPRPPQRTAPPAPSRPARSART